MSFDALSGGGILNPDGSWSPSPAQVNETALFAKAQAALANNVAYLAIVAPTQAQAVAQVAALTRQVNALIHLAIADLEDTSGT